MTCIRVLVCALLSSLVLVSPSPAAAACSKPLAIAHRFGTERYPENTRQAERWAADVAGARWLETDVQFDRTDTPFVLHDETLDRMTNFTGAVADHDLSADRAAGLRVDGGYILPTMYEVLTDLVARPGVQMQIEIKTNPTPTQLAKFLARMDWTGTRSRVVVTSFDPATLDLVKAAAPDLRRALIDDLGWQDPATITPHAGIYSKHFWSVTLDRERLWTAAGLQLTAWTPDTLADWKRMASYGGIYGVVTNKPNAYRLASLCA